MDGHGQMNGRTSRTAMNDPALDREIESLLASEPSPEFVARVRARIAQERAPGRWRASWMFAAACAASVVIVAVMTWPSSEPMSSVAPESMPQVTHAVEATEPAPLVVPELERRRPTAPNALVRTVQSDRAIDIDLPAVVIAENEAKTFASLVARVRRSRFDVTVPAAPDPDVPLEIKELPPVEPLEIEPIVRVAALQPEGERP